MLILSRHRHERIYLPLPDGREITLEVTEVHPRTGAVRLGIEAPSDVLILRHEVAGRLDARPGPATP